MENPWFKDWFNTPYYHTLYKSRNDEEAQSFIDNLYNYLSLTNEFCLDLACGKGRHSKYLNSKGLRVLGLDLSEESIKFANKSSNDSLTFDTHDMRDVYPEVQFDLVFNLFTSFGYFDEEADNTKVLDAVFTMLKPKGRLIIDFMNATKVINTLVNEELKQVDGIDFHIERNYTGSHFVKDIKFEDDGESFSFSEKVQALKRSDFERLLIKSGFTVIEEFGSFGLDKFDEDVSDRLIIVAEKS